jgi:hypothetical protein
VMGVIIAVLITLCTPRTTSKSSTISDAAASGARGSSADDLVIPDRSRP